MRFVDLARRPFVNRRPVVRLALMLWALGALLLLLNLWLWGSYWVGSASSRDRLAEVTVQVSQERQALDDSRRQLQQANLRVRNNKARYLNRLIERRTFPWSALFDDLEDVLPRDVFLISVKPSVTLVDEVAIANREERRQARSAQNRRGSNSRSDSAAALAEGATPAMQDVNKRDRINLVLDSVARDEDVMLDFVDALFEHPSFRLPNLPRESVDKKTGLVKFSVSTFYLVPQNDAPDEPGDTLIASQLDGASIQTGARDPGAALQPAGGVPAVADQQPAEPSTTAQIAAVEPAGGPVGEAIADQRSSRPKSALEAAVGRVRGGRSNNRERAREEDDARRQAAAASTRPPVRRTRRAAPPVSSGTAGRRSATGVASESTSADVPVPSGDAGQVDRDDYPNRLPGTNASGTPRLNSHRLDSWWHWLQDRLLQERQPPTPEWSDQAQEQLG